MPRIGVSHGGKPTHSANRERIINTITTLIIGTAGLIGLIYARKLISIAAAYKAKVLCSGVFISGRSPQSVLQEDLEIDDLAYLRFIATDVDYSKKLVTANFFGLVKRIAVYNPALGSALVYGDNANALDRPHPNHPPWGNAFELSRHTGRDCRYPEHREVNVDCPPWPLGSGNPCRNDEQNLNSTALPMEGILKLNASTLDGGGGFVEEARLDSLAPVLDWAFAEPDPKHLRRTRAVVVLYQGKIVAERYAPGFEQDMPLPGWSMAKGVVNALVGILVGQGKLNLNSPALVPEWQREGDPRREITLDQLMRMTSGLEFSEKAGNPFSDVVQMLFTTPDAAAYAANKPLTAKPGTCWNYASGTSNLISRIIRHTLGDVGYGQFPYQALFGPLGMSSARFESDASGTFVGSSFLFATARDWAKFGLLYCHDGVWMGERILPEGWVHYSTTPETTDRQYGAHFWLDIQQKNRTMDLDKSLPADAFHAIGYEGQCVSIVPSRQLVVVRLGLTRKSSAWRQDQFLSLIVTALAKND